jgi:hypothetical protein
MANGESGESVVSQPIALYNTAVASLDGAPKL